MTRRACCTDAIDRGRPRRYRGRKAAATKAGGGQYADLTELFCTADRCPVIVGNTLVYLDDNHVTTEYAQVLAPVIGALADRALTDG